MTNTLKDMRKVALLVTILLFSESVFSQNPYDTRSTFFKSFRLSLEAGYNFLIPSATESDSYYSPASTEVTNPFSFHYAVENPWRDTSYGHFHHHQWSIGIAAESRVVKWRLSMRYDCLDYEQYAERFQVDHLRLALGQQFYILKKEKLHILFGPELELGWITRYMYFSGNLTMRNPDVGQKTGCDLLFPLSVVFPVSNRSRVSLQVASGLHLRNDHDLPYMNHFGYGPGPEAEFKSYCPLSIGIGYSLCI